MKYQLKNDTECVNALRSVIEEKIAGQIQISDFYWLIVTIKDAIDKGRKVELRYDTPTGLLTIPGTILSAELTYDSKVSPTELELEFKNSSTGDIEKKNYQFVAEFVEENKLSNPRSHMKYYIKHTDNTVMVGLLFLMK